MTAGGETLQGLERGLAVIQAFSHDAPAMTLSEVARRTDISRATARRILLTLESLGFVRSDGRDFSLSPRVLTLGWAYLSSLRRGRSPSRSWRSCRVSCRRRARPARSTCRTSCSWPGCRHRGGS